MDFEWDDAKRLNNLNQRGVDFIWVTQVFNDPRRVLQVDDRRDYGEDRLRTLGMVEGVLYAVIYTMRGKTIRIITAWKAGRSDRRKYQEFHDGPNPRNDP